MEPIDSKGIVSCARRTKENAVQPAVSARFKARGEEMNAPQCQRALSTVWVRVVVLTRSSAAESALVGCSVGAYWRDLRWRNHRSLRGKRGPTAKRSRQGITSVCSGGFIPHLRGSALEDRRRASLGGEFRRQPRPSSSRALARSRSDTSVGHRAERGRTEVLVLLRRRHLRSPSRTRRCARTGGRWHGGAHCGCHRPHTSTRGGES